MIYDFKVKNTAGEEISLEKYKGKVLLIVNTASGCGFTPQYEGLQKIYDENPINLCTSLPFFNITNEGILDILYCCAISILLSTLTFIILTLSSNSHCSSSNTDESILPI